MSANAARRARRSRLSGQKQKPRWLLIADRSFPRIEVAAAEVIDGVMTFRMLEAVGATRSEAMQKLGRLVAQEGGVFTWFEPLVAS
jgi:hypothetical protein